MVVRNKTILITGGTSGIGRALAHALLKLNNTVLVVGRNEASLAEMRNVGCTTYNVELTSRFELEDLVVAIQREFGGLDVLINNAGVQHSYNIVHDVVPHRIVAEELHTNVVSVVELTRLLVPLLFDSENPTIVHVTSALSRVPKNDALVYSMSKAAVRTFVQGLRKELPSFYIAEVIPPVVRTGMTKGRAGVMLSADTMAQRIVEGLQSGKKTITTPSIAFLLLINVFLPGIAWRIVNK